MTSTLMSDGSPQRASIWVERELVTNNTADFEALGVPLVDWTESR